jgi:Flp pilus assembly protein TadG
MSEQRRAQLDGGRSELSAAEGGTTSGRRPMNRKRFSGQRGVSVVEAPIVLIVIAFFALGVLGFVQIFIQYQHLTSASRSAARYATKADYDPSQTTPKWGTRPSKDDVIAFAQKSGSEFKSLDVQVQVCEHDETGCVDGNAGTPAQHVHVRTTATINDGPYTLISGLVDGLSSFFGGGDAIPKNVTIHSEAVAAYE